MGASCVLDGCALLARSAAADGDLRVAYRARRANILAARGAAAGRH
jgi:hypothetical protein